MLRGRVPDEISTPQRRHAMDGWPRRLADRAVTEVRTHGKHLYVAFEGDLVIHSHLRMTGAWGVYPRGRRWRRSPSRAWLVLHSAGREVVQFDGPVLELLTESRTRFDQRLAALGPDILAGQFDAERFLRRMRADDPTRGVGDALLDQRTVAGIGNMWKAEGCWEAGVDPWREVRQVPDSDVLEIIERLRPRMLQSARLGPRAIVPRVYGLVGRPCPRCGGTITSRGQGEDNRITFWCPGCQR